MTEPIISVSGLRGVVGDSLTPAVVTNYGVAFAAGLPPGPVLISRDSRNSGEMLSRIISGALRAVGRDVIDAAIAATPTTGVLVRHHQCAGGIQISASHNPPQYNGMKLFSAAGRVISADAGLHVMQAYREPRPVWVDYQQLGGQQTSEEGNQVHGDAVLATVDVKRIQQRKFKVLLDANHGAGSILGRHLLTQLGCQIEILGAEPDGQFQHAPEPTADNLQGVCAQVGSAGVDVGFCQDPDADRLAVIDEQGRYIGEEFTLVLCLDHILQHDSGAVVTNCATSRMSADVAAKHGAECFQSAVGEANVTELMMDKEAVFGGEGNGGPIDPRVGYVRDSFVGMALILNAMAEREKRVSQLVDELPRYAIHKTKVTLQRERISAALDELARHFTEATPSRLDGLRLDWPDQWLLVRASNTEPIVRLIAEATTSEQAEQLTSQARQVIECIG